MISDPATVLDLALGSAALVVALLALIAGSRLVQAMALLGLGVVLSLVWLRLGSLDVALAEAALGSGLLGAILVWVAVTGRGAPTAQTGPSAPAEPAARDARRRAVPRFACAGLGVVVGVGTVLVVCATWVRAEQQLPAWTAPLAHDMAATGVSHEVTAVLLSFRAYDTLLESAVLMLAGVTALSVGRDPAAPRATTPAGRSLPPATRWAVRLLAPVLLLLALWVLFAGSSGSGGAFQSGAVLAGLLILLHATQAPLDRFITGWLRPLLVVGVVVFLLAGALGPLTGLPWLAWDPAWAFGVILTVEIALTAGITAGLFLLYLALDTPQPHAEPAP